MAKRMSNLLALDVITKWIPASSHENLITTCSIWRVTFVPPLFLNILYTHFRRFISCYFISCFCVLHLAQFTALAWFLSRLGANFTPIHGDNKRKLIPLTSPKQPERIKLKTVSKAKRAEFRVSFCSIWTMNQTNIVFELWNNWQTKKCVASDLQIGI